MSCRPGPECLRKAPTEAFLDSRVSGARSNKQDPNTTYEDVEPCVLTRNQRLCARKLRGHFQGRGMEDLV